MLLLFNDNCCQVLKKYYYNILSSVYLWCEGWLHISRPWSSEDRKAAAFVVNGWKLSPKLSGFVFDGSPSINFVGISLLPKAWKFVTIILF